MKYTEKIHTAIILASILHDAQRRKGDDSPYINHPYGVGFLLGQYTDDEDIVVAGLLHDVLEDVAGYSLEDMERDFGARVANIVLDVTEKKDPRASKKIKKDTWQERKDGYISHLSVACEEALFVSCADKIHNIYTLTDAYRKQGDTIWKKFRSQEESLWFYGAVLEALKKRLHHPLIQEYERAYQKLLHIISEHIK